MSESNETAGLELGDYIRIFRKSWLLILICTVLGAVGAGAFSKMATPLYQASASTYVSVRSADSAGVGELAQGGYYASWAVSSYVDVIESAIVLKPVIDDLNLDMTTAELAGMVSASAPTDTVLINIDVTGPDAEQATEIANSIAENFADVVSNQLEKPRGGEVSPVMISTIQPATLPTAPVSPNVTRNVALGLMLGLLLGVGGAVLRAALDTRITSPKDLSLITDVPTLGAILDDPKADKHRLIVHTNPRAPRSESFRSLRTNMQFVNVDSAPRSFVVTSSAPNEGKTTVATNLAISLAQAGASVVLVDADLRKPSIAKFMDVDGTVGLTNLLVGMVEIEDVIHRWGKQDLFVLPAGRIPPNPSELLGSVEMRSLLTQLTERFEYVIIDTPPILAVTDAAILSRLTGGTLVVAALGLAKKNDLIASLDALDGIANRLSGVVLTHVPSKGPDAYHYARYEYAKDVVGDGEGRIVENPLVWLDDDVARQLPSRHAR